MDVARRLVQIPAEKVVCSAAARVSALVTEIKKEFEQDPASTMLVDNLEKMARDEQIFNAFMHSDAFQSSMMLWDREFKTPNSSSSTSVIENQNNNNTYSQQHFITTTSQFTLPTFSDSYSSSSEYSSSETTTTFSSTTENTFHSSRPSSFDPELQTYQAPRWNTVRTRRVPISDRIVNYMSSFWKIFFFRDQPVLVGQPNTEEISKSVSIDDFGVPGSPPQEFPVLQIAIAGVAILLLAMNLRYGFEKFQMTAAQGKEAAHMLVKAFISKARNMF
jgi:hypothetical protein